MVPITRFLFHVKELEQIEPQSDEVEQQGHWLVAEGKRKKLVYESNKERNMLAKARGYAAGSRYLDSATVNCFQFYDKLSKVNHFAEG